MDLFLDDVVVMLTVTPETRSVGLLPRFNMLVKTDTVYCGEIELVYMHKCVWKCQYD